MKDLFTFRPGTSDANIWHDVYEGNEYRLPDRFEEGSVVIDIGAHIGSFTQACIDHGAYKVYAFEPEPENFALFRKHLAPEIADGRVDVFQVAIHGDGLSMHSFFGYEQIQSEVNTGASALLGGFVKGKLLSHVLSIGLDDFLAMVAVPFLIKCDSEGSEWDMIRDSTQISKAMVVCGEYHEFLDFRKEDIKKTLEGYGFNVTIIPHENSPLGLFWAKR